MAELQNEKYMVFNIKWFADNQVSLLKFSNSKIGRKILGLDGNNSSVGDNKIVEITPNSITWVVSKKNKLVSTEFRTNNKFAKCLYKRLYPLWWTAHQWDTKFANIFIPEFNLGFDSLTAYPAAGSNSPVDGQVYRDISNPGETFATIIGGAGNGFSNTDATTESERITCSNTTNQFLSIRRSIFCFDTSIISGGNVSAAVLSLYGEGKSNALSGSPSLDIVSATPDSTSTLANSDFGNVGSTSFANITFASYSTSAYNDFTLDNNGRANVSTNGISKFGAKVNWDTSGVFGGTWVSLSSVRFNHYYADETGTSRDPKLEVTYSRSSSFFLLF